MLNDHKKLANQNFCFESDNTAIQAYRQGGRASASSSLTIEVRVSFINSLKAQQIEESPSTLLKLNLSNNPAFVYPTCSKWVEAIKTIASIKLSLELATCSDTIYKQY